jgi:hypothetical protein
MVKPDKLDKYAIYMKITNEDFWELLRINNANFQATADAITKVAGGTYSRQAVHERAMRDPDQVDDIKESNLDLAERGMMELVVSDNESIKFKACETILKRKGGKRGWGDKQELDITGGMDMNFKVEFIDPDVDFE